MWGLWTGEDAQPLLPLATAAGKVTAAPSPGERSREGWTPPTPSCCGGIVAPNLAHGGPAWRCSSPGTPSPALTRLPSSSTLTAKSLSLSPSAVNTPTASSCSPTLSAGERTDGQRRDGEGARPRLGTGRLAPRQGGTSGRSRSPPAEFTFTRMCSRSRARRGARERSTSRTEALTGSTVIRHEWSGL